MENAIPHRIRSISEFHRLRGLQRPEHPLISVLTLADFTQIPELNAFNALFDFYFIASKKLKGVKYKYRQLQYDFEDDGLLAVGLFTILKYYSRKSSNIIGSNPRNCLFFR